MRDPLENAELLAFTKAVEAGSLSRAAAELRVPRATLSRRLARLEQRLGARLLRRTTRSLTITDAGEALFRHARIALDAVEEAEASVRRRDATVRGPLRLALPLAVSPPLLDLVADFATAYPEVRLQTHLSTRFVDLQRDGYDVALRASSRFEPGLVARTLVRFEFVAVAAPAYLAARGTPASLGDLRHHRCLMGFARGELPETHWSGAGPGAAGARRRAGPGNRPGAEAGSRGRPRAGRARGRAARRAPVGGPHRRRLPGAGADRAPRARVRRLAAGARACGARRGRQLA